MRILIAEDDPVSRRILSTMLAKWGYDVVIASDGSEAWEILRLESAPNLAILDWMMPGTDGIELCRRVRSIDSPSRGYTYLILLTARGQKQDVVKGMESGADDYVTKPFDSGELRGRLRAAERILELESRLLSAQKALKHQVMHDSLTGLWNRSAILDALRNELARAQREHTPLCAIIADIDHFKSVNDTYGHETGDNVLTQTSQIMQSSLREYDSIGRYGGEEFLIIIPGCEEIVALKRADFIRRSVEQAKISVGGRQLQLTISMGIAVFWGTGDCSIDEIVEAADNAMYCAKRTGRNRVEVASAVAG